MPGTVAERLIEDHLVEGDAQPGEEIGLRIDHSLTQDATGTLVMLELEAMGLDRVATELSAQYVDHNLLQTDFKNPDDHVFLRSACDRFGVWYSPPGQGVSHPVHMEAFGRPGATMVGSDSHTPAAGALGMLAIGAGGLEAAMAMAGKPLFINMPEVWGVELTGELPDWVSAKDVILEMLRRHDVDGGVGRILEYHGPGLEQLDAWDRHVLANMGTELGATTTVFPADDQVERFLHDQQRPDAFQRIVPDDDVTYDVEEHIDLSELEPLIAKPSSPGNVVTVESVAGSAIYQSYIGSSANPGLRDFAVPAMMVDGQQVRPEVSFDVNPTSRQMLENLDEMGLLKVILHAGGRLHQTGCNGCIGMGQAPATGRISLRTVPRNFPGRSGTKEDSVYLCSPETATASAITGEITDPRTLEMPYPQYQPPDEWVISRDLLVAPPEDAGPAHALEKGPNVKSLPNFEPLADGIAGPVLMKVGDDVSTDEIMPAGAEILPYRSNIPAISKFVFHQVDESFHERARAHDGPFLIVGGTNYGQGSSREHAALAPYHLGLRAVITISFARIHWQNLINFGILPLTFQDADDHGRVDRGDTLRIPDARDQVKKGTDVRVENVTKDEHYVTEHTLSDRQVEMVLAGGLVRQFRVAGGA